MMIQPVLRITTNSLWKFLIVVGMTYCSGYAYSTAGSPFVRIIFAFIMLLGCILISNENKGIMSNAAEKKLEGSFFLVFIPLLISIISGWIMSPGRGWNNFVDTSTIGIIVIASYLIVKKRNLEKIRNTFINLMLFIAVVALIVNWFPVLQNVTSVGTFINRNGAVYNNGVIWFTRGGGGKMMGIFWEGGLFASYLLLALSLMIMSGKRYQLWKHLLFIIAIISTNSTAGVILLFLVLTMWLAGIIKNKTILYCVSMLIIVAAMLIYINTDSILNELSRLSPELFGKLVDSDSKTTATRLLSPVYNFEVFKQSPIWGVGITEAAIRYREISLSSMDILGTVAQTSTSTFMLAAEGIMGIAYTLVPCLAIGKNRKYPTISKIVYIILFICVINKEPHYWLALTYLIMFSEVKKTLIDKGDTRVVL